MAKAEDRPTRTSLLLDRSGSGRGRHEDHLEVERSSSVLSPEARLSCRTGDPGREYPFLRPLTDHHRQLSMTCAAMDSFSSSAPGPKGSSGLSYLTLLLKEYSTAPLICHFELKAYPAPNVA